MTRIIGQNLQSQLLLHIQQKKKKKGKQAKKTKQQAEQTHNFPVSILVFVCDSYIFCDSYTNMLSYGELKSTSTSYMLYEYE